MPCSHTNIPNLPLARFAKAPVQFRLTGATIFLETPENNLPSAVDHGA